MTNYGIEVGENKNSSTCYCCENRSCIGHGFVYKNDDAYAVYYAGWSDAHLERKVSIALAIGEWDDDSTINDRTCFGVEASEGKGEIFFRVIEPAESPWSDTDLLGTMLVRAEALSHPLLKEVYMIADIVLRGHIALREYLAMPEE